MSVLDKREFIHPAMSFVPVIIMKVVLPGK